MNEKSRVSKELNAKHTKILEGLLKFPENRECAECKTRGPRWASVNLGIFICLHCSGVHRSLGVHISKVRSATLDTWLPDQIAFIQTMGNQKSNSYWEAELPTKSDRVNIENFIRAKYVEKRWIPRNESVKSSPNGRGQRNSTSKSGTERSAEYIKRSMSLSQERKASQLPDADKTTLSSRNKVHYAPSESPKKAARDLKPEVVQNAKPVALVEDSKRKANVSPDSPHNFLHNVEQSITPTVSIATINHAANVSKIYADTKRENGSVSITHSVGSPQPAEPKAVTQQNASSATIENKNKFDAGIEELIKDFQWNTQPVSENLLNNVNNEPCTDCPTTVHQQQQTSPASHQSPFIPATVKHFGGSSNNLFSPNWGNKQIGSTQFLNATMSSAYALNGSMFSSMPVAQMNGITPTIPVVPMQSGYQYDFSSLTREMLSRQ